MPFNAELEDFAQAFSTGYAGAKSKEEREAEQLELQHKRFLNERDPITAGQEDIKFGLDVDIAKGQLSDAADARARKKITDKYEDDKHKLDMQYNQGLINKQERDAKREVIDNAFNDANNALILRKGAADASQSEYLTSEPVRELERRKGEALIGQSESAARSSDATTAGTLTDNQIKELELEEAQRKNNLRKNLYNGLINRTSVLPEENQPRTITGGTPAPAAAVPEGPAPFVYRPPPASTVGPVIGGPRADIDTGGLYIGSGPLPRGPGPYPGPEEPQSTFGSYNPPLEDGTPAEEAPPPVEAVDASGAASAPAATGGPDDINTAARAATKGGLEYLINEYGLGQEYAVGTPEVDNQQLGFLTGAHAASPETVKMTEDTVEEQAGESLSQNEKTYYSLASTWLYHNGMNEPEEAKKAAASLLQHYQYAFSQYVAIAQAATSKGDIDGAMEAAVRAYANIPTGDELDLSWTKDHKHIIATTKDMDGKVTQKQLMTPEEMGAFAMNINPSSFVTFITQAAGREDKETRASGSFAEATSGELGTDVTGWTTSQINAFRQARTDKAKTAGEAGKGGLTPDQRGKVSEDVGLAFGRYADNLTVNGLNDKAASFTGNTDLMMNIRPITERIAMDNPGLGPDLAVEAVTGMIDQMPTEASIDGDRIRIKVEGVPAFSMDKDLYYRLSDVRSKFAAPEEVTQEQYNQRLGDLRRTPEFGLGSDLRPYDPNRLEGGRRSGGRTAVDAGPDISPRTGQPVTPLLPGGPTKLEGPSRANLPRTPKKARPRSRSDR